MKTITSPSPHGLLDLPKSVWVGTGLVLSVALLSVTGLSFWLACLLGVPLTYLGAGLVLYLTESEEI